MAATQGKASQSTRKPFVVTSYYYVVLCKLCRSFFVVVRTSLMLILSLSLDQMWVFYDPGGFIKSKLES